MPQPGELQQRRVERADEPRRVRLVSSATRRASSRMRRCSSRQICTCVVCSIRASRRDALVRLRLLAIPRDAGTHIGVEIVQVPAQPTLMARAVRDEIVAMIDEQPELVFGPGSLATGRSGSRIAARATASASIGSRLAERAHRLALEAINFGGTRTTRSPAANNDRSRPPREVAAVLDRPQPLARRGRAPTPTAADAPARAPAPSARRAARRSAIHSRGGVRVACAHPRRLRSRSIPPFCSRWTDRPADSTLSGRLATLLSSHAGRPRTRRATRPVAGQPQRRQASVESARRAEANPVRTDLARPVRVLHLRECSGVCLGPRSCSSGPSEVRCGALVVGRRGAR